MFVDRSNPDLHCLIIIAYSLLWNAAMNRSNMENHDSTITVLWSNGQPYKHRMCVKLSKHSSIPKTTARLVEDIANGTHVQVFCRNMSSVHAKL